MRIRRNGSCRLFLVLFSVCFVLLLVLAPAQTRAQASQTINVSTGNVAGLTSAIQTLNSTGGGTIDLASGGTYSVTAPSDWWYGPNAFPAIASNITINGNGATISRASGSPNFRFFYVSGGVFDPARWQFNAQRPDVERRTGTGWQRRQRHGRRWRRGGDGRGHL